MRILKKGMTWDFMQVFPSCFYAHVCCIDSDRQEKCRQPSWFWLQALEPLSCKTSFWSVSIYFDLKFFSKSNSKNICSAPRLEDRQKTTLHFFKHKLKINLWFQKLLQENWFLLKINKSLIALSSRILLKWEEFWYIYHLFSILFE